MKADYLAREFAERSIRPESSRLLLRPADAIVLIDRAAEEGVPIVRVLGSLVAGQSIESPREHLADYAPRVRDGHGCWEEADIFIRQRRRLGLVFELTLGDDPVEAV